VNLREVEQERRALARCTTHLDLAPVLVHDAIHRRQTEARALVAVLGGVERLEDMAQQLLRHATPCVLYREANVRTGLKVGLRSALTAYRVEGVPSVEAAEQLLKQGDPWHVEGRSPKHSVSAFRRLRRAIIFAPSTAEDVVAIWPLGCSAEELLDRLTAGPPQSCQDLVGQANLGSPPTGFGLQALFRLREYPAASAALCHGFLLGFRRLILALPKKKLVSWGMLQDLETELLWPPEAALRAEIERLIQYLRSTRQRGRS